MARLSGRPVEAHFADFYHVDVAIPLIQEHYLTFAGCPANHPWQHLTA